MHVLAILVIELGPSFKLFILSNEEWAHGCIQVKHFDRQFCAKKRVKRLLDTGDRARGPINLPASRVGLQPGEH